MPTSLIEDCRYQGSMPVRLTRVALPNSGQGLVHLGQIGIWSADFAWAGQPGGVRTVQVHFTRGVRATDAGAVGVAFDFQGWSPAHYVIFPGAVYAGNRFTVRAQPYSPRLEAQDAGLDIPTIITDVPRLESDADYSALQQLAGDLATPAIGIFDPGTRQAWWCFVDPESTRAPAGFTIKENLVGRTATVRLSVPAVRERFRYRHCTTLHPSNDAGQVFDTGDSVDLKLILWEGECPDIPGFLDRFLELRSCVGSRHPPATLPFSAARELIEAHYNRDNWREAGFYATDCSPDATYPFQTGWCGGGIASAGLLDSHDGMTRARAIRTSSHLYTNGVSPSGFFWGKAFIDGTWGSDFCRDVCRPEIHNRTLVRRQADALYYGLKQIESLGSATPLEWTFSLRGCADAFARLWRRYGQFGQFVHQTSGELIIGNSASGALAPGALALAAKHFDQPEYLAVGEAAGRFFRDRFVLQGFTTGGPGDALQNPDSESCAALLESYMELHAATGAHEWLDAAQATAALLSTWVMSYDYAFPPQSEFGRLSLKTTGTVFANTQNKHSAPGICTGSGIGLWKLYRSTRDRRYMDLLADIARALPQFISREDRPIHAIDGRALPSGWINERVNTSDWDDNVGGVFLGSTWCEVAMLLTAAELPGVYVDLPAGRVWALDHVDATLTNLSLTLRNNTRYPARVKLAVERATIEWQEVLIAPDSFVDALLSTEAGR